jgi:hypothetical protein
MTLCGVMRNQDDVIVNVIFNQDAILGFDVRSSKVFIISGVLLFSFGSCGCGAPIQVCRISTIENRKDL